MTMDDAERALKIDSILAARYPASTALEFTSPWSLLVSAILAAQCTDERVNKVVGGLFSIFPNPKSFAEGNLEEIEEAIHSTGFYRQKAKTLKALNAALLENFGGEIPKTAEELTTLPGVGRKTANLVLGNAMGIPAIFVDTHVGRISARMGFTKEKDPDKIERDLMKILPRKRWTDFSNLLTHLGRDACAAKKAKCGECPVAELCPKVGL
ncbi:endonuclease III [bacterium]|nr:MAG: endonuclease III [bacterium]